jgi:hypothetical protein
MPSPGSAAQAVIDSAQPVLDLIKATAEIGRMQFVGPVDKKQCVGERYSARGHRFVVMVGHGPDDDRTGTIYARFVFQREGGDPECIITVAKDVLTGRWLSHNDARSSGPAMREAVTVSLDLDIRPNFDRDIGEERALSLIKGLADFLVIGPKPEEMGQEEQPAEA